MAHENAFRAAPSLAPEHDWAAASKLIRPALRPSGTAGSDGRDGIDPTVMISEQSGRQVGPASCRSTCLDLCQFRRDVGQNCFIVTPDRVQAFIEPLYKPDQLAIPA